MLHHTERDGKRLNRQTNIVPNYYMCSNYLLAGTNSI